MVSVADARYAAFWRAQSDELTGDVPVFVRPLALAGDLSRSAPRSSQSHERTPFLLLIRSWRR